jgi:hypothetical protein
VEGVAVNEEMVGWGAALTVKLQPAPVDPVRPVESVTLKVGLTVAAVV